VAGPATAAAENAARRPRADRCPGALVLHEAADGGLARIRLPGGQVDGGALAALAAFAQSVGERGAVELTSRGNVQLRGVPADRRAELAERAAALGLLPSATHERVRNIVAAPYAGLTGAARDPRLDELVRALDRELCADPELAGLSGRFLFGLDDVTGDICALAPDAWAVPAAGDRWWVGPAGVEVGRDAVVVELLAAAREFLRAAAAASAGGTADRHPLWRVRDLPDGGAGLAATLRAGRPAAPRPAAAPAARAAGVWRRPDGGHAAAVHVPLGRLSRAAAELLAAAARAGGPADAPLRVTPWRSIVVPRLMDPAPFAAAARRAGLDPDPGSLWARVTAGPAGYQIRDTGAEPKELERW
jgi:precorrin-3B synthase